MTLFGLPKDKIKDLEDEIINPIKVGANLALLSLFVLQK